MASSYSTNLRVELMANGENDATWGTKTNTSIQLLEAAIAGRAAVTHDDTANYTLTTANGSADEARRMILNIGGALSAARNAVVPTQSKFYVVKNATTGGFAVTVKTSAGTGISVPNGKTMMLFCDGTNVVEAIDQIVGTLALTSPAITTSITTPSTSFDVFNTTATTVNAFGAASTALNIGHASAAAAFPGGISIAASKSITGNVANSTISNFLSVTAANLVGGVAPAGMSAGDGALSRTTNTGALFFGSDAATYIYRSANELRLNSVGVVVTGTLGVTGALTTNGGLQTFGANDSGGAGYRLVLVPNI